MNANDARRHAHKANEEKKVRLAAAEEAEKRKLEQERSEFKRTWTEKADAEILLAAKQGEQKTESLQFYKDLVFKREFISQWADERGFTVSFDTAWYSDNSHVDPFQSATIHW